MKKKIASMAASKLDNKTKTLILCTLLSLTGWYFSIPSTKNMQAGRSLATLEFPQLERDISSLLVQSIHNDEIRWPNALQSEDKVYSINYTLNAELEGYLGDLLSSYLSDYTSVVVLDNNTGAILAALDYSGKNRQFGKNLTFAPSSPAASLFKVITAADAIEKNETNSEDVYYYLGRATTLYRHQLNETQNRYLKAMTLTKAFAHSNNVVFGKVALKHSDALTLYQTAAKFGFNQEIFNLIKLSPSYFPVAVDQYNLAELASGLNTLTLLSPIHAAKIAMIIANNGKSKSLKLVKSLERTDADKQYESLMSFPFQPEQDGNVISASTASELQKMMRETVRSGTAKVISKKLPKNLWENLDIGGKTGQMTGGIPEGKRDWFIAFARPKSHPQDLGISIAVMVVNQERWYIRSTQLAKEIIQYYFNNLFVLSSPNNYYSYHKKK